MHAINQAPTANCCVARFAHNAGETSTPQTLADRVTHKSKSWNREAPTPPTSCSSNSSDRSDFVLADWCVYQLVGEGAIDRVQRQLDRRKMEDFLDTIWSADIGKTKVVKQCSQKQRKHKQLTNTHTHTNGVSCTTHVSVEMMISKSRQKVMHCVQRDFTWWVWLGYGKRPPPKRNPTQHMKQ